MEKVYEIYIRTTPERLWEAITDSEIRSKYNFGARVSSDWRRDRTSTTRSPSTGASSARGRWSR